MASRSSRPMSRGKAITAAALLSIVGFLIAGGCTQLLVYSAGLAGTPGTFRVDLCETVGSGRGQHVDCYGTYRSDDGRITDQDAVMSHAYAFGTVVPVERSGPRGYYPTGFGAASGALSGVSLGLVLLSCAGLAVLQQSPRYPPRVPGRRVRPADLPRPLGAWTKAVTFVGLCGLVTFPVFLVIGLANGM